MALRPEDFGIGQLFAEIPDAVVIGDASTGSIILWNDAAAELFGWTADEVADAQLAILVPDELRDRHNAGLRRFAAGAPSELVDGPPVELPAVHRSGSGLWVELRLRQLRQAPPGGPYLLAVIRDITERHQLRERERARAGALQSIVTSAAHDLKSPLSVLHAALALLEVAPEGIRADILTRAERQVDRLNRLVTEMLDAIRLEADADTLMPEPILVAAAVMSAVAEHAPSAQVGVTEGLSVFADPDDLDRILANLLRNAVLYGMPPVTVTAAGESGYVVLEIHDGGEGLPAEVRARVFQPFVRGSANGEGTGLGLAAVRRLAERNGGEATYVDGSTFRVRLPAPSAVS